MCPSPVSRTSWTEWPLTSRPATRTSPAFAFRRPVRASINRACPFPFDAGDADDLPGANREREAADSRKLPVVDDLQVFDLEQRLGSLGGALLDP